jgi:predicted N-formylglutamate amidohydrolase
VPARYAPLFRGHGALLRSHRGWDPGALEIARALARSLEAPLVAATTTRLLVDLNRSPHNRAIFSELTRGLSAADRATLIDQIHAPHWDRVRRALDGAEKPVLHVAVHSFTPRLEGQVRDFEIGLLYDPARAVERGWAKRWRASLREHAPRLRVRLNAPYRGNADGLTTSLRRERGARHEASYAGIELEMNQAALRTAAQRRGLSKLLARSLKELFDRT